jgi:hypothetical protein
MLRTANLAIKHLHTLFPAICSGRMDIDPLGDLPWAPVTLQALLQVTVSLAFVIGVSRCEGPQQYGNGFGIAKGGRRGE